MDTKGMKVFALLAIIGGFAAWMALGSHLRQRGALEHRPNVLHLNGSPYGRTLAFAMRGPADIFWHRGQSHEFEHGPEEEDHEEEDHGMEKVAALDGEDSVRLADATLDILVTEFEEHEAHEHANEGRRAVRLNQGARTFALDAIDWMRESYYTRNNERGETLAHKFYILRETERRLAISYHMDPTNLACYGSYFLFLSEALARMEGAEGEKELIEYSQKKALKLARYTINYCLNYGDEAPAVITAAVAAHDALEILFSRADPPLAEASELLKVLDHSVQRYEQIRGQMQQAGTWTRFPEPRIQEMESSYTLVKIARQGDHDLLRWFQAASEDLEPTVYPVGTAAP